MFPIHMMRSWNRMCDSQFYDVGALTETERQTLAGFGESEGGLVVVYPAQEKRQLLHYQLEEFLGDILDGQLPVRNLVVAGVGCSALGTAALARNVADYTDEPVCGIVSGMEMADVITEGLGGWYALGARSMIREWVSRSLTMSGMAQDKKGWGPSSPDRDPVPEQSTPGTPDALALLKILLAVGDRIRLVVGHSKGNYSIESALEGYAAYCRYRGKKVSDFQIVTLGALVRFPDEITRVKQVIGGMDFFGAVNSRPFLGAETIPLATHTTNPDRPFPLIVARALELAGVAKKN